MADVHPSKEIHFITKFEAGEPNIGVFMLTNKTSSKRITPQNEDFSKWYIETIKSANLMDYAPVRGCIVFKPDSYELWENIKQALDIRFKETGHRNVYFPMLIPESFFEKEKNHVEGFSPELPWVTEVANESLEERLALRPTSETMIGHMYSQWIQSYRDLPLLLNQWANVFRWEKRTLPFIRTSEFLWQEGHTAHTNEEEARQHTMQMLEVYREVIENELAIPCWMGQKTPSEKFAGAVDTYSIELMMKDGKAVQAGTSHYMGENFSKAFDITFSDKENKLRLAHTTSWGTTTRLIGSIIMVHGDDQGLVLPPRIAHTQVVIIPIGPTKKREAVMETIPSLVNALKDQGIRVKVDDTDETPGWKFNEWELKGVPLRVELGPRDLENNQLILARRDTGEKITIPLDHLGITASKLLDEIQENMLKKALEFRENNSHYHINTVAQLQEHIATVNENKELAGWVLAGWCGNDECESKVKEETKFTTRNIPFAPPVTKEECITCGQTASHTVWFARAY